MGSEMCIRDRTSISLIIERTILQIQMPNERPNLRIMPINHGMHANKIRPAPIRPIKVRQLRTVRIRPSCSNKYRPNPRMTRQIILKARPERRIRRRSRVLCNSEMISFSRRDDEVFDCIEGIRRERIDRRDDRRSGYLGLGFEVCGGGVCIIAGAGWVQPGQKQN